MPVYLDIFNLIVNKKAVTEKYSGGINQFRIDYNIPISEINQEDDELFSLGQMNADQFNIDHLISSGLSFDEEYQKSDDFTIVYRYGNNFWEVNWLEHNSIFAWHIETNNELKIKMAEICKMNVEDIVIQMEMGNNLLWTIRAESSNS
jgi:hypothetical protein